MASNFHKRLQRIEELLAAKINRPLAFLWLNAGETHEEACIRAGYDVSQIDRIKFVRWLTAEEAGINPPEFAWDVPEAGPPKEDAGQTVRGDVQRSEAGETPVARDPVLDLDNDPDRRAAKRLETEKLREATKAYAKTIA